MTWTQEKIAQLKELWKGGTIAAEIGKRLGTSKNAVIAKANRLHCAPRKQGGVLGSKHPRTQYISRKVVAAETLAEMGPENPTTLENLTPEQCKFPLGREEDPPEFFCGRQRWIGTRKHASHYCKHHVYIATRIEVAGKIIKA